MSDFLYLYFPGAPKARELDPDNAPPSGAWQIGRNPKNDIVFGNMMVSAKHASLRYDPASRSWQLWDNSTNGTRINNQQILPQQWHTLDESDRLTFGCKDAWVAVSFIKDDTLSDHSEPDTAFAIAGTEDDDFDPPPSPTHPPSTYAGVLSELIAKLTWWQLLLLAIAALATAILLGIR